MLGLWLLMSIQVVSLVMLSWGDNRLEGFTKVEDFLNVCLDGQQHKISPGPESGEFQLVSQSGCFIEALQILQ